MAYPPQFSSTATYANRYDLDEIDVFLEGDANNPMFFSVKGLPQHLNYGKHYFTLSILDSSMQQYELTSNSQILFEFKSINNVILRSDVIDINQKNGVAMCYVEVLPDPLRTFEEVEDGDGILTIVGILQNKSNTINLIPNKFEYAVNYRCTFPIEIRKNLLVSQPPSILNISHTLCTTQGQFAFGPVPISPIKTTGFGVNLW